MGRKVAPSTGSEMSASGSKSHSSSASSSGTASGDESQPTTPRGGAEATTFGTQFNALFRKNLVRQSRQKVSCGCQILFPVLVLALLYIIQYLVNTFLSNSSLTVPGSPNPMVLPAHFLTRDPAFDDNNCAATPIPDVVHRFFYSAPPADSGSIPMGTYGNATTGGLLGLLNVLFPILNFKADAVVRGIVLPSICYTAPYPIFPSAFEYLEYDSLASANDALYKNWTNNYGAVHGGYAFDKVTTNELSYTVIYNDTLTTGQDAPVLINRITSALLRIINPLSTGVYFTGYANAPSYPAPLSFDLVSLIGPSLYVFVFQLSMPLIVGAIVYEKEHRLQEIMKMMGLRMTPYWVVTYIYSFSQYFVVAMFTWAIGAAVQFRFFTVNDPSVIFVFLFVWGHLLVAFSLFLSTFFSRSLTSIIISYLWVFGTGLLAGQLADTFLANEETNYGVIFIISIIPTGTLFRGLRALGNGVSFDRTGLKWEGVNGPNVGMGETLGYMAGLWVVFMLLAFYLEAALPTGYGIKKHPCFCFGCKKGKFVDNGSEDIDEGEDLAEERERARRDTKGMLRIQNLRKVYPGSPPKVAVHNLSMVVDAGQCFGFLGSNGAGKTTTINIVTGLFPPTSGTAFVDGLDIRTDIDAIHTRMGVCPQDNILWGDLTGTEHLLFYGRIKNLKGKELTDAVRESLESVNLADPSTINKLAREYSGGMQRRLSVAISLIGNPKIVLLDEPSTGLDPASRRQLWDIILKYKTKCAMLLTTHAMEEADALCDRLALFDSGRLQCIDTSAQLKRRFGKGFKVTVTGPAEAAEGGPLDSFVRDILPQAALLNHLAGTRNYEVPKEGVDLATVFERFEEVRDELEIKDWGISNTTLEEVFLRVNGEMDDGPKPSGSGSGSGSGATSASGSESASGARSKGKGKQPVSEEEDSIA